MNNNSDEVARAQIQVLELEEKITLHSRPFKFCVILWEETTKTVSALGSMEEDNKRLNHEI